jgi:capsular polysaccharide biosynthesis protein
MELSEYIRLAVKWFWLFLVAAFVAGGISFIGESNKTPYYTARTTISIGGYIASPNPNSAEVYVSRSLVPTYLQLLETRDVLQGTIDALRLDGYSTDFLKSLISAQTIADTSLMVITVTHVDPILAADIANAVADQLISQSPTNLTAEQRQQADFAQAQIDELSKEVASQRQLLSDTEEQLSTVTDSQEIARLTNLRLSTTEQINLASSTIA